MADLQEIIYQQFLKTEDANLVIESHRLCDCYSGKTRGMCCFKV